eukprot:scaffold5064_cov115-Isochrysis_galbana.AAC.3
MGSTVPARQLRHTRGSSCCRSPRVWAILRVCARPTCSYPRRGRADGRARPKKPQSSDGPRRGRAWAGLLRCLRPHRPMNGHMRHRAPRSQGTCMPQAPGWPPAGQTTKPAAGWTRRCREPARPHGSARYLGYGTCTAGICNTVTGASCRAGATRPRAQRRRTATASGWWRRRGFRPESSPCTR